ncbi:MAG: hypothetical protein WBX20_16410 [Terrimicrobiaceae bacterium]
MLHEKNNPRFIVTNLPREGFPSDASERFAPAKCYEEFYCPRANMAKYGDATQIRGCWNESYASCLACNIKIEPEGGFYG